MEPSLVTEHAQNGSYLALGTAASASVASTAATQTKISSNSPTPMFSPGTSAMTWWRESTHAWWAIFGTHVTMATDKRAALHCIELALARNRKGIQRDPRV